MAQDKRLFSKNEVTGITEYFVYDEDTDQVVMTMEQDLTDMTDQNQRVQNEVFQRSMRWGDFARFATVPMAIYAEWLIEGKDKDQAFLKKWANDSDNRKFRTRLGRV